MDFYENLLPEEKYKLWEDLILKILTQYPNTKDMIENFLKK